MSEVNGHSLALPEGATLLTGELLDQATLVPHKLEALSAKLGKDVYVKITWLEKSSFLEMLPSNPPGMETWPDDVAERQRLYAEWMAAMPEEQRAAHREALGGVVYRAIVAGTVEPKLTMQQARRLGDDAVPLGQAILRLSGLVAQDTVKA